MARNTLTPAQRREKRAALRAELKAIKNDERNSIRHLTAVARAFRVTVQKHDALVRRLSNRQEKLQQQLAAI